MMRKGCIAVYFLLSITLLATPSFAQDKKIKIGVIAPLTGGLSTIGNALKNGIELSRARNSEKFKNIEFFYEDDLYDTRQSITAYKKLRGLDKVDLIFGFGVKLGNALAPIVEQDKVLLVNVSFEATPAVGSKYVMRTTPSTAHYMKVYADYADKKNEGSYAYVRSEISFFTLMAGDFKNALGSRASVEEIGVVNPDVMDFRTMILKLKKNDFKNIGLFLLPEQIIAFARQSKAMGAEFNYFGTDLFESAAILTAAEGLLEGSTYPDNSVSNEFVDQYSRKYGNEAQITIAANGYEIALLFAEYLENLPSYTVASLLESLSGVRDRESMLGKYSFKSDPETGTYFDFPIYVKSIVGSRGVVVEQ